VKRRWLASWSTERREIGRNARGIKDVMKMMLLMLLLLLLLVLVLLLLLVVVVLVVRMMISIRR